MSPSVALLRGQVWRSLGIRCQQHQLVDYTCGSNRIFPATDLASLQMSLSSHKRPSSSSWKAPSPQMYYPRFLRWDNVPGLVTAAIRDSNALAARSPTLSVSQLLVCHLFRFVAIFTAVTWDFTAGAREGWEFPHWCLNLVAKISGCNHKI